MRTSVLRTGATLWTAAVVAMIWSVSAGPSEAAQCQPPGGFNVFITEFRAEAARKGISQGALAALDGVTEDRRVISLDRNQKAFKMSFEQFARQRITSGRLNKGKALLKQHANLLASIEQRYGVPGPVIVAIWGLETDFGGYQGDFNTLRIYANKNVNFTAGTDTTGGLDIRTNEQITFTAGSNFDPQCAPVNGGTITIPYDMQRVRLVF